MLTLLQKVIADIFDNLILFVLYAFVLRMVWRSIRETWRLFYPPEQRKYVVYSMDVEFTGVFHQPTFVPIDGSLFKGVAELKATRHIRKGHNAFVHRNLKSQA